MRTALLLLVLAAVRIHAADAPEQPVPYSHKWHVGTLELQCKMCHPNPDPGEKMTLPAAAVCMTCHSTVKTDSPAIRKLAAFAKENKPVPWVRVYQIPSYVDFSHRKHLARNTCQECHGDVASLEKMAKAGDISMGACVNCHQAKQVSTDCTFCHEER